MKIEFTTDELNYLIDKCQFNEINGELEVLKMKNVGNSIVEISLKLNVSVETINRRIKNIKKKIKKVL
ncbi:MAG: LuxR C-terminal-related transcriptional regulator [Bacilli bacterium]